MHIKYNQIGSLKESYLKKFPQKHCIMLLSSGETGGTTIVDILSRQAIIKINGNDSVRHKIVN